MHPAITRVETAINHLRQGKMVILTDNPNRENEGDLIFPAEIATAEIVSFMLRHCSGIICLPMTIEQSKKLDLPLMVPRNDNTSSQRTPFTVSIEARAGVSTGVSVTDRVRTIRTAANVQATAADIVKPGHIFPLQARAGGVLERNGHTEGSVDLMRLAGFNPVAVLCEVMNHDGTMARGEALTQFAKQHNLVIVSIDDLIIYRLSHENFISEEASAELPLESYGEFNITVARDKIKDHEHVILTKPPLSTLPMLVRVHSSCITGDIFGSRRCDCHQQLNYSLQRISAEGGMLIYLHQEGRGIGLLNKVRAYALQEQGFDTVDANTRLGLPVDAREYYIAANILRNRGIQHIRLLTNNPAKVSDLKKYGITNIEMEALPVFSNEINKHYLQTKKERLQHLFDV
ncbi:MAG: bifunctional 3,4-dihydroxy-2-butanone 4-phosphate synthase/GTP cyclohydrolase II [Gammaproteobacteria bacterium RIFCSPHIGHO2_12_FULL_41_20]|nr:MAG: bifunctional 3,4-dihydroxy-2-butanone 4-phosphate synthase/GTP cyclohydrolase II [Gammaproteobacteria bacterium RIFCSPHIGHO2_12_FULL_41_20]